MKVDKIIYYALLIFASILKFITAFGIPFCIVTIGYIDGLWWFSCGDITGRQITFTQLTKLCPWDNLFARFEDIKKQEQEALEKTGKIIFEVGLWQLQHLGQSNRRAFASKYKDKPYSSLYFLAYDGKIQHSPIFSDCSKFVKFFNIK